jgi:hypothetical protein
MERFIDRFTKFRLFIGFDTAINFFGHAFLDYFFAVE